MNGSHSDVTGTATFSHQVQQGLAFNWTLNIAFPANSFIVGKTFRFNNGRNQQQDATVPAGQTIPNPLYGQTGEYSADILGSGVLIPEYADNPVILPGMFFTGIVTDRGVDYPFSGRITNKIGTGYSPLDGYGFINAEAAVAARPDLIVSTLKASNKQAPQGSKVTLTATIKNQGNASAGASKTEFLLDGKTVLGLIDTPNLAPGASATISVDWYTASVQKGQHTIKTTADRNNTVIESTETNNTKSVTVSIQGNQT
ncbi:MAG: hypothetical protein DME45_13400 [Verrucomicrobia bacterium]|nr:MAG: hypothetical protein DME45_13400 [Verrucomicrobiota bacterium]